MSFLKIGQSQLNAGEAAGGHLRQVLNLIQITQSQTGSSLAGVMEKLIQDTDGNQRALLLALRTWSAEKGHRALADLLTPLREIERRSDLSARQLGWPAESWTVPLGAAANAAPFEFSLELSGGAVFEVLEDGAKAPQDVMTFDPYEAIGKLAFNGKIAGAVGVDTVLSPFAVSAGIDGSAKRSMELYYGFDTHNHLSGLALAAALSQLRSPSNALDLQQVFDNPSMAKLRGIVIDGDGAIGAKGGVKAKFPTQYGTFGIDLSGVFNTSRGFRYTITKDEPRHTLNLKVDAHSKYSNALEIGASYVVGLSTISPIAASQLLANAKGLYEVIETIDEKAKEIAGEIKSWLKPGDLIKAKISEHLDNGLKSVADDVGTTVIGSLARVFGFSDSGDLTSQAVIDSLNNQLVDLIAGVTDDFPKVLNVDEQDIRKQLNSFFKGIVDPEVLQFLDKNVFSEIKGELDKVINDLAGKLNAATKKAINELLGMDGEAGVDEIIAFIEKVRAIAKKILDGISKAQTELLVAEIGWRRERSRSRSFDYEASFDPNVPSAVTAFRQCVMSPRKFGKLLISEDRPAGVTVNDMSVRGELFKETGHRWNIALVGLAYGGTVKKLSELAVVNGPDGVSLVSKGRLEKTKNFLKEVRTISFVSAMNLAQAQTPNGAEPHAAASIKINFEEEDNKFHVKEAKNLLKRFRESGMLSEDVWQSIRMELIKAQNAIGRDDVPGSISVGLAIPSDQVIKLLGSVNVPSKRQLSSSVEGPSFIDLAAMHALAIHDPESIDIVQMGQMQMKRALGLSSEVDAVTGFDTEGAEQGFARRMAFMQALTKDNNLVDGQKIHRRGGGRGAARALSDKQAAKLAGAIKALREVLEIGSDIHFNTQIPPHLDLSNPDPSLLAKHEEFENYIEDLQVKMIKKASKFLKTGTPLPKFFGGKAPSRTVAMFDALQRTTFEVTKVKPPLMITFTPEGGTPKGFFSLTK